MTFYLLFVISGIILSVGTFYLARRFKRAWKMPKGIYLKAGLVLLVVEIFHYSVLDGLISYWPDFVGLDVIFQGLLLGIFGGLFFELGRFFALDKIFKGRSFKEAVYFSLGWNGVTTFVFGLIIVVGVYGLYTLLNTGDISLLFPEVSGTDLERIEVYKEEASGIVNDNPFLGIAPIFERGSLLLIDVLLTLIIVLGFVRGTTAYVWIAVLIRSGYGAAIFILNHYHHYLGWLFLVAAGVAAYVMIKKLRDEFPENFIKVKKS